MDSQIEDSYKRQYSLTQYIDDKSGKKYYEDNKLDFINNCMAIVKDINRILTENELNKDRYVQVSTQTDEKELLDKIPEDKFKSIIKKAGLKYDDILSNIFHTSNNDDDILLKMKTLSKNDEEKYLELKDNLEEYFEIRAIKKNNIDLNKTINSMKKMFTEQKDKLDSMEQTIKEQNDKIDSKETTIQSQNKNISDLKTQIDNLTKENIIIKEKLGFMEIIVKASLSRKIINHCMNKIMAKYEDSLIIEEINKDGRDKSFKIIVKKEINEVSVKDSNDLINSLFEKKDHCNTFVHFEGIKKPSFIEDTWEIALNFLALDEKEKENFNKIITKDIKDSFKFSQKDEPVNIKNKK